MNDWEMHSAVSTPVGGAELHVLVCPPPFGQQKHDTKKKNIWELRSQFTQKKPEIYSDERFTFFEFRTTPPIINTPLIWWDATHCISPIPGVEYLSSDERCFHWRNERFSVIQNRDRFLPPPFPDELLKKRLDNFGGPSSALFEAKNLWINALTLCCWSALTLRVIPWLRVNTITLSPVPRRMITEQRVRAKIKVPL